MSVETILKEHNIQHQIVSYPETVRTTQEAAEHIGIPIDQIAKSLVLYIGEDPHLFLIQTNTKINTEQVKTLFGQTMRMASTEDVFQLTGYRVGTVSPIGLTTSMPSIIDDDLMNYDIIGVGCGEKGKELLINPKVLKELVEAEVKKVSKD